MALQVPDLPADLFPQQLARPATIARTAALIEEARPGWSVSTALRRVPSNTDIRVWTAEHPTLGTVAGRTPVEVDQAAERAEELEALRADYAPWWEIGCEARPVGVPRWCWALSWPQAGDAARGRYSVSRTSPLRLRAALEDLGGRPPAR